MGAANLHALVAVGLLASLASFTPSASGTAWLSLYCGNRIVHVGDEMPLVAELCGAPQVVSERVGQIKPRGKPPACPRDGDPAQCRQARKRWRRGEVVRTVWVYDLGPRRFKRRFVFHDWKLVSLQTLGYGSDGADPPEPEPPSDADAG